VKIRNTILASMIGTGLISGNVLAESTVGTVSENLDVHMPFLTFKDSSIWADLGFYGQGTNGELLWMLKNYGINEQVYENTPIQFSESWRIGRTIYDVSYDVCSDFVENMPGACSTLVKLEFINASTLVLSPVEGYFNHLGQEAEFTYNTPSESLLQFWHTTVELVDSPYNTSSCVLAYETFTNGGTDYSVLFTTEDAAKRFADYLDQQFTDNMDLTRCP